MGAGLQPGLSPPRLLGARAKARPLSILGGWSSFLLKSKLSELPFFQLKTRAFVVSTPFWPCSVHLHSLLREAVSH